jgi:hypothetical protein
MYTVLSLTLVTVDQAIAQYAPSTGLTVFVYKNSSRPRSF